MLLSYCILQQSFYLFIYNVIGQDDVILGHSWVTFFVIALIQMFTLDKLKKHLFLGFLDAIRQRVRIYEYFNSPVSCLLFVVCLSSDSTFVSTTPINISFWISSVFCRISVSDDVGFFVPGLLLLLLWFGESAGNLLQISIVPYSTFCKNLSGFGNNLFPTQEHSCSFESQAQWGSCSATQSLKYKIEVYLFFVNISCPKYFS